MKVLIVSKCPTHSRPMSLNLSHIKTTMYLNSPHIQMLTFTSYIKELADRLGNLEGAIQAGQAGEIPPQFFAHQSPLQRRASDDFSPPPPPSANSMAQKRPYSSVSSGEFHSPYQQRQQSSWTTQEPQRHLSQLPLAISSPQSTPIPSNVFREPNYSPNGLPPLTQWRNAPEPVRRQSASFDIAQSDRAQPEHVVELDGAVVKWYLQ